DYFEIFGNLSNDPQIGIIVANGSGNERIEAKLELSKTENIIVDLTSINTLVLLDIKDLKDSQKFKIVQSLKDEISTILIKRKGLGVKGFMSIDKVDGDFVRLEVTKEQIENHISYLESMLVWIEENCEVISLDPKFLKEEARFDNLSVKLGDSFIHSMLLAKQLNGTFYSDDYALRMLSKNEYKINGVWSQIFLQDLLLKGIIDKETYYKYIVQLLSFNYRHLAIDHYILIQAAKMSNWLPIFPFNTVINVLSGSDNAIYYTSKISVEFIYAMWLEVLSDEKRNSLLFSILENLTRNKNVSYVLEIFNTALEMRFKLLPLHLAKIQSLIEGWKQVHIN
ncbi:MAG TPA: hypothetical protein PLN22_16525, partial [Ignavibacteria bacterium]|nr:hypothetical protein [Ignavibacteria bacterium]